MSDSVHHIDGPLAQIRQMADWVEHEGARPYDEIPNRETLRKVAENLRAAADALAIRRSITSLNASLTHTRQGDARKTTWKPRGLSGTHEVYAHDDGGVTLELRWPHRPSDRLSYTREEWDALVAFVGPPMVDQAPTILFEHVMDGWRWTLRDHYGETQGWEPSWQRATSQANHVRKVHLDPARDM